ncbi:hypothetical protein [Winogradskyella sp. SYSU M77433]|uniref:hypothetical protein n=1 Tax=Winogradskyella sp. SYSU M77433 TaxID=3042722 RepID=UPI0024803F17|nr:hypothetical protein [Winogradskyella sp. SYSU M77433]MDH7913983.1 hypothetical protein [Winogradskyella sp. SYSU M77433]
MKKITYIVLALILINASCLNLKKDTVFDIKNYSGNIITDVVVSNGVNEIYTDTIKPNEKKSVVLKFKGVPKTDGGYKLQYNLNSDKIIENFGYYSNGIPLNSSYEIKIEQDTILISEIRKK